MSAPAWFDYETYFANKLAQLKATDPEGNWTEESLTEAFEQNGFSIDADGLYKHFVEWGNAENVSPSPFFNYDEYMQSKLDQLLRDEPEVGWTMEMVKEAFADNKLSAWDHYLLFGQEEGINPSTGFDTKTYLDAKLEQLLRDEPEAEWTMEKLIDAFQANGVNPIEHFILYGQYENLDYTPTGFVKPATDTLTVERDVLTLGEGDQVIEGVSSALKAENTLNANDNIDGGEGNDTLRVTLDSNFSGFKVTDDPETTGGMKNVENVELINNGTAARSFSAKGSEGVSTYTLTGEGGITVKDLAAAGVTVNVNGMQKDVKVEFTSDAVKGTSDSMTFGLTNVGAAETADAKGVSVKLAAAGVENVSIKATGNNFADLTGVTDATSLTVTGSGSLDVDAVASKLTSVDASAATGNVEIDLTSGGTMTSIKGGAGDDTFIVKNLDPKAVLEGGEGTDTLILDGAKGTLQPTMSGFETIGVTNAADNITLSAKNIQDFSTLVLASGGASSVTVSGLTDSAFTVISTGDGENVSATNTAVVSDAVDLTVNIEAAGDAGEIEGINTQLTADKATSAVINVGANVDTTSSIISLDAAESVQLNVASSMVNDKEQTSFIGQIDADKADSLVVNAEGKLGGATAAKFNVAAASSVVISAAQASVIDLQADTATDVNLTFNGATALTGNLSKAQSVTINQQAGTLTTTSMNLSGLSSLTLSGEGVESGKESTVKLNDLGGSGDYDVTVTATGLAGGFTAGTVTSAQDITLDFSQMTGAVTLGSGVAGTDSINAASGDVTILTSALGATTINYATGQKGIEASGNISIDVQQGAFTIVSGAGTTYGAIESTAGDINLTFGDASTGHKIGALSAVSGDITIDASGLLDGVGDSGDALTIGAISGKNVTIYGSETGANVFSGSSITAETLNFTGGLLDDSITITTTGKDVSLVLNTGLGADKVSVQLGAKIETLTLSGDLGGQAGDSLTFASGSSSTNLGSLKEIDLSGLDGYNTSTIDMTKDPSSNDNSFSGCKIETLKLGGGQDTVVVHDTYKNGSPTNLALTIDGFTAGADGDVLNVGALSGSAAALFTGPFSLVGEDNAIDASDSGSMFFAASDISELKIDAKTADDIALLFLDTDNGKLYHVAVASGTAAGTTLSLGDDLNITLTGIEGDDFDVSNFVTK